MPERSTSGPPTGLAPDLAAGTLARYTRRVHPLVRSSRKLSRAVDALSFAAPVAHVYNPLVHAREPHERYLERYGTGPKRVVWLGMNPGPFGMAQTGVPFGDVGRVRGFLGIDGRVGRPPQEHPKRPIQGFACPRSEVSGTRLWGWVEARFGTAEAFFAERFVANYCPLVFLEASGRNLTPDHLPAREREALFAVCDAALSELIDALRPAHLVAVGGFAAARARSLGRAELTVTTVLHPSPASPAANRGWAPAVERALLEAGVERW